MQVVIATDAGSPDQPNEDFAAAAPGAAVLLDGATAPADVDTGCIHGVAWYAQTLGTALLAGITAVPHVPLQQALADWLGQFKLPANLRLTVDIDPQSFY